MTTSAGTTPHGDSATPPITSVVPAGLRDHWAAWLGATSGQVAELGGPAARTGSPRVLVVGSTRRTEPGWDGAVHAVVGLVDPHGRAVLSVAPADAAWANDLVARGADLDALRRELPDRLGRPGHKVYRAGYRWTTAPAAGDALADVGRWLPVSDPRVPPWLRPFGGEALVVLDATSGGYLAGVGLKRHDEHVHELAVGTDEAARGRGLARRLVAQVARHLLARDIVPTYLHDPANIASARVAAAAGLPDRGWTALGLADTTEPAAASALDPSQTDEVR